MKKKILTIGIILLFIGLTLAPSINANKCKNSGMVEYTIELYGLRGGKRLIKLTQDEANDLELLFDDFQNKLINIESRAEAKEIVSYTLSELNKYGFLGDLSIKQVQRLIFSGFDRQILLSRLIEKIGDEFNFWNTNLLCLVGGYCENVEFIRMSGYLIRHPNFLNLFIYPLYIMVPLKLMSVVQFGSHSYFFEGPTNTNYAKGIVSCIGLLGPRLWIGEIKGTADVLSGQLFYGGWERYIGIIGYNGIQITRVDTWDTFLLGFALYVNMKRV